MAVENRGFKEEEKGGEILCSDFAAMDQAMKDVMELRKSLPPRPSLEDLEAAQSLVRHVDLNLASRLHDLELQHRQQSKTQACEPVRVLSEILHRMRVETLQESAFQDKKNALELLHVEDRHRRYDDWIQQAHDAFAPYFKGQTRVSSQGMEKSSLLTQKPGIETSQLHLPSLLLKKDSPKPLPSASPSLSRSLSLSSVPAARGLEPPPAQKSSSSNHHQPSPAASVAMDSVPGDKNILTPYKEVKPIQDPSVLDMAFRNKENILRASKISSFLDTAFKNDLKSLDLHGVFLKELEWVPESLMNLTWLTSLNLSGNRLEAVPDSIGNLVHLTSLDLSANLLVSLPDIIGKLTSLQMLNIENNKIEEIPWTIGQCVSLMEIMGDFNKLKALPEAIGSLAKLRSLSVHYNCLKSLPTTMATMKSLLELDVHFNQLESISESLCLVTTLEYLNAGSNFTDLKELPASIGRLQSLKHLDASFNQLTVLPDSFAMLTNLETLNLEGNPLRIPPLNVVGQGKDMVLQYMIEFVAQKEKEYTAVKKKRRNVMLSLGMRIFRYLKKQRHKSNQDPLQIRA